MDLEEVPVDFGMALMRNEGAMNAFAMLPKAEKRAIWAKARKAKSREEMERIVNSISLI